MTIGRRHFLGIAGMLTSAAVLPGCATLTGGDNTMFGLIGSLRATPGQRDALVAILLDGIAGMPGCLSYIVARDLEDADLLWITEVWDAEASHRASLSLPQVQAAIAKARPLIAGSGSRTVTAPVGGHGLSAAAMAG
jgi:quinol monooxygenase YgiN